MYAGAPYITAVSLLGAGASALAVVTAVWIQTARGVVYCAGLATRMRGQPAWFRWAGPYLLVDPLFAPSPYLLAAVAGLVAWRTDGMLRTVAAGCATVGALTVLWP